MPLKLFRNIEDMIADVSEQFCCLKYRPELPEGGYELGILNGDLLKLWGLTQQLTHEAVTVVGQSAADRVNPSNDPKIVESKAKAQLDLLARQLRQAQNWFSEAISAEYPDVSDDLRIDVFRNGLVGAVPKRKKGNGLAAMLDNEFGSLPDCMFEEIDVMFAGSMPDNLVDGLEEELEAAFIEVIQRRATQAGTHVVGGKGRGAAH